MPTPTALITIGETLEDFKVRVRQIIMDHYVQIALRDQRPATQRAMDTYKVGEAKTVLAGGTSSLLDREATMRGITALQLARLVIAEGVALESIELDRVEVSLTVDSAANHSEILKILAEKGIVLK